MFSYFDSYQLGLYFGRGSLILYLLTLLPGICGRFRLKHRLVSLLTLYRRQVGISMYMFAVLHALNFFSFSLVIPTFKLFGLLALLALAPLFITSNDYSVKKLKQGWKTLHQLTYPALGLIFLHISLNRWSIFSVATLITLIFLGISFLYERYFTLKARGKWVAKDSKSGMVLESDKSLAKLKVKMDILKKEYTLEKVLPPDILCIPTVFLPTP